MNIDCFQFISIATSYFSGCRPSQPEKAYFEFDGLRTKDGSEKMSAEM